MHSTFSVLANEVAGSGTNRCMTYFCAEDRFWVRFRSQVNEAEMDMAALTAATYAVPYTDSGWG